MAHSHRFEVKVSLEGGVRVLHWQREVPADTPGWDASEAEARRRASRAMTSLANDLYRQADHLTRDERGL